MAPSVCWNKKSIFFHSREFVRTDLVRFQLFGLILNSEILTNGEIHLGEVCQEALSERYSLIDDLTWRVKLGGCRRFRISFSSVGLCHFTLLDLLAFVEVVLDIGERS